MKYPIWLSFVAKSVALGLIISGLILALVPELRKGSTLTLDVFKGFDEVPDKQTYYNAVSQSAPAVVTIFSSSILRSGSIRRQQVERSSLGSGVIMTKTGHILTCLHVIQNAESIIVILQDGRYEEAEIVGVDPLTDLAVLKIAAGNLQVIPQVDNPETRVGDVVLAIGNPLNIGQTITQGIVSRSGHNITRNFLDFIQTDAVLHEGSSGGALVDSNGVLVGINNANFKTRDRQGRIVDVNGIYFAVPYTLARRVMDEIISSGAATHGQLGFTGTTNPTSPGILVTEVLQNGPADLGGLRQNDVIVSINRVELVSLAQTLEMIAKTEPGENLTLSVSRDGILQNINVTVGEVTTQ